MCRQRSLVRWFLGAVILSSLAGCAHMPSQDGGDGGPQSGSPQIGQPENRQAAKINTELGVGYYREGHLDIAVKKLKRAIAYDDSYAAAHHAYALVLDSLGEESKAKVQFERAYELDPNNADLENNYATFLCGQKRYDRAQKLFARAYGNPLYKTPEFALSNSGICYEQAGDYAKAVNQFQAAVRNYPNYGPALLGMARANYRMHKYAQAARSMRAYERQNRHTPASLKLAIEIDQATHNGEALANHALILRGRFPDSPEAKWYENGMK